MRRRVTRATFTSASPAGRTHPHLQSFQTGGGPGVGIRPGLVAPPSTWTCRAQGGGDVRSATASGRPRASRCRTDGGTRGVSRGVTRHARTRTSLSEPYFLLPEFWQDVAATLRSRPPREDEKVLTPTPYPKTGEGAQPQEAHGGCEVEARQYEYLQPEPLGVLPRQRNPSVTLLLSKRSLVAVDGVVKGPDAMLVRVQEAEQLVRDHVHVRRGLVLHVRVQDTPVPYTTCVLGLSHLGSSPVVRGCPFLISSFLPNSFYTSASRATECRH